MTLEVTPEQEARIQQAAQQSGRSVSEVLTEAALWLLKFEESHDASLQRSLDQADRGEFLEEEEMDSHFERMMQAK
jgi:predicted transcriptional regulator